jgi:hypothetical protein
LLLLLKKLLLLKPENVQECATKALDLLDVEDRAQTHLSMLIASNNTPLLATQDVAGAQTAVAQFKQLLLEVIADLSSHHKPLATELESSLKNPAHILTP